MSETSAYTRQQAASLMVCPHHSVSQIDVKQPLELHHEGLDWLKNEAYTFLHLFHMEQGTPENLPARWNEVQKEIEQTGTYWHTTEELYFGAKVGWRNNTHCIGRLFWKSLKIRDMRHLSSPASIFESLVEHLELSFNDGKILPMVTIFAPQRPAETGIRIWNPQLIRYAGYRQPDGTVVGDPLHVELTDAIRSLGWGGGKGTPFDVLPVVIQMPHQTPEIFDLPQSAIAEVPIAHPTYPWFAEMGLKWHAIPAISNMRLEIGGISYTAAPFSGWYMGTEIGVRNFTDLNRYNLLPVIAEKLGLDVRSERTLWKDRALVELNVAVLHSFEQHKIRIVDHHTATAQFNKHVMNEQRAGRVAPAEWSWMVPPMSGALTPVFHQTYENIECRPNWFNQPNPWEEGRAQLEMTLRPEAKCPF